MCFRAVKSGNAVFLESNCSAYSSKLILSLEERGLIKTSHLELSPPKPIFVYCHLLPSTARSSLCDENGAIGLWL